MELPNVHYNPVPGMPRTYTPPRLLFLHLLLGALGVLCSLVVRGVSRPGLQHLGCRIHNQWYLALPWQTLVTSRSSIASLKAKHEININSYCLAHNL